MDKTSGSLYCVQRGYYFFQKSPNSLHLILRATLHTKQETYSHDNYIHKYREVQSNYNKKFKFNLILDLNAECEVTKTVSWGKLFHNGMTLGKKRGRVGSGSGDKSVKGRWCECRRV